MEIKKEKMIEVVKKSLQFFQDEKRMETEFSFLIFVIWRVKSFSGKEEEMKKLLFCMEAAFQRLDFPKELPTFLLYYLKENILKGKRYETVLPLPKNTSVVQSFYILIPENEDIKDISGTLLTPKLSEDTLSEVDLLFGEKLEYDGAACLGSIAFSGGDVASTIKSLHVDLKAYGKGFMVKRVSL